MKLGTSSLKLAAAACLALGSAAFAEPAPGAGPADQGTNAQDRASGRDTNPGRDTTSRQPEGTVTDRMTNTARDAASGAGAMATNAGSDMAIQQQLAAIKRDPATASDKLFALDAAMGNMWEVEFSKVVAEKAQDAQIKQAAQQLINDHSQAQQKLSAVAQQMGVTLPSSLPSMKQQKLEIFRAMPADKLETCFVVDTKADHARDVTSYSDHAKTVQNDQLKGYINDTLPRLQAHAQHIQTAAAAKGLPGEMTTASGAMGTGGATGAGHANPAHTPGQLPTGRTE